MTSYPQRACPHTFGGVTGGFRQDELSLRGGGSTRTARARTPPGLVRRIPPDSHERLNCTVRAAQAGNRGAGSHAERLTAPPKGMSTLLPARMTALRSSPGVDWADEVPLAGGGSTSVSRRGDVVFREARPWSSTVVRLLRHLEVQGYKEAPRVVGAALVPTAGRRFASSKASRTPVRGRTTVCTP